MNAMTPWTRTVSFLETVKATINVLVLVFICFMFKAFLNQKNWKDRFTLTALSFLYFTFFVYYPWLFIRLTKIIGDLEENPGPKCYSAQYLAICHGNLNSIAACNFIKVAILKAYLSVHEMDTYAFLKHTLTLLFQFMMQIPGYSSVRANHSSNETWRSSDILQTFSTDKINWC